MKKYLLLAVMCLWALVPQAQKKCAVLTFQSGIGVSLNEADAVTLNFRSYFRPTGYTLLAGNPVDNAAKELGLYNSRNNLTHQQIMQLAKKLGADYVIVSALDKFGNQYHADISIVNVANCRTCYTDGSLFGNDNSKKAMETLAKIIASKLPNASGNSSSNNSNSSNNNSNNSSNNSSNNNRTQNTSGNSNSSSQNTSANNNTQTDKNYVDLGLPSGTKWAKENYYGNSHVAFNDIKKFLTSIPTVEQWMELKTKCTWTKKGKNYIITGPNGNSITLPAEGYRDCKGGVFEEGIACYYWTRNYNSDHMGGTKKAFAFKRNATTVDLFLLEPCNGLSFRAIKAIPANQHSRRN